MIKMLLTLKKQWFDMILNGEKKEEYREIKPYWTKRFENYFGKILDISLDQWIWSNRTKTVVFRNGYGNDVPEFTAECSIREDYGNPNWSAEKDKKYYVLSIYKIYDIKV